MKGNNRRKGEGEREREREGGGGGGESRVGCFRDRDWIWEFSWRCELGCVRKVIGIFWMGMGMGMGVMVVAYHWSGSNSTTMYNE